MSGESLCQRPLEWPSVKHLEPSGGEWPVSMGEGPGSSRRKEFSQETWFKQKFFEIKARQNKDSTERLECAIPWCVQPREFQVVDHKEVSMNICEVGCIFFS